MTFSILANKTFEISMGFFGKFRLKTLFHHNMQMQMLPQDRYRSWNPKATYPGYSGELCKNPNEIMNISYLGSTQVLDFLDMLVGWILFQTNISSRLVSLINLWKLCSKRLSITTFVTFRVYLKLFNTLGYNKKCNCCTVANTHQDK